MLFAVFFKVKPVGKPDAVAPHVRFDERGWETGLYATAPVLDSTGLPKCQFAVITSEKRIYHINMAGFDILRIS